jgi:hypothetical protein
MNTDVLKQWESLWRYPDLLTLVVDSGRRNEVESKAAARAILRGIAAPATPRRAFSQLLGAGEFKAAEELLASLDPSLSNSPAELEEMNRQLAEARRSGLEEIEVRLFELETRMLRLGVSIAYPTDLDAANTKLQSARDSLTLFEYDIQAWEERRQQQLREQLSAAVRSMEESPNRDAWEQVVLRCIERGSFLTAENLLAAGTIVGDVSDPALVPRRPVWPYVDGARNGLRRFLRRGDLAVEFAHGWGLRRDDQTARQLLFALEPLVNQDAEPLAFDVEKFVTCLDTFLGGEEREHYVREWSNGFSSVLYSLNDQSVPRLAMCGNQVPIWLPRNPNVEIPPDLLSKPVLIVFHPEYKLERDNVLSFTTSFLFRIAGDPNRRINFIRGLARQIKPSEAMPPTFELSTSEGFQYEGTRTYAAWFFDYHAIGLESDSVFELISFYSAKHPGLLCALLREICYRLSRSGIVSTKQIHAAWNSPRFQQLATHHLLGRVQDDPYALAVLACSYLLADEKHVVTPAAVKERLDTYGHVDGQDISDALQTLIDCSLLTVDQMDGTVWTSSSASVRLIRKKMGDLDSYIRTLLAQTRGR